MKNNVLLFLVLALIGCETESKLTTAPRVLKGEGCTSCAEVHIKVPEVMDETPVANAINTAISEELIYFLEFDEEDEVSTVEAAIVSFDRSYQKMIAEFGPTTAPWEAEVLGTLSYESPALVSLHLDTYSFTGGAHGYSARIWLNFDVLLGEEVDKEDLFEDLEGFSQFVETRFRKAQNIAPSAPINSSGFMFEDDIFHLPEHIGFTQAGLQLHYNQYEIASYADGPIEMTIPLADAKLFLKPKYLAE